MNTIFLCNFKHLNLEVLSLLIKENIRPVAVFTSSHDFSSKILSLDKDIVPLFSDDIINARFPEQLVKKNYSSLPVDSNIIIGLSECHSLFIPMMQRLNFYKLSVIQISELFFKYLAYWNGVFSSLKPSVIVFHNTPHEGSNYVAYHLAKILGIKTLMLERVLINNKFFILDDLYTFPKYDESSISIPTKINKDLINSIQLNYKNAFSIKYDNLLKRVFSILRRFIFGDVRVLDPIFSLGGYPSRIKFYYFLFKSKFNIYILKKFYSSISVTPNLSEKFIYFPLHLQPERTTLPMGRFFWSHQVTLDFLLAALPSGWLIYVKEHPRQFTRQEIYAPLVRDKNFYRKLVSDKRVRIINHNFSSQALIDNCQVVATISGTVGWEGITSGVPVCLFGYPWYRQCPEIFFVESLQSLKEYLSKIDKNEVSISLARVEKFSFWIENHLCSNAVLKTNRLSHLEVEENSRAIADALLREMPQLDTKHTMSK